MSDSNKLAFLKASLAGLLPPLEEHSRLLGELIRHLKGAIEATESIERRRRVFDMADVKVTDFLRRLDDLELEKVASIGIAEVAPASSEGGPR